MKPLFKTHNASLVNHVFQTLLVTYLLLLLIEQIWTGFVSIYLNLNYLLIIVIIAGILDVFSEHKTPKKQPIKKTDYLFILLLGIAGFAIIKTKTTELGWLSWLISIIAGILIILLSLLVLEDDDEEDKKTTSNKIPFNFLSIKMIIFYIIILAIISLNIAFFTQLTYLSTFRIIFGSLYVLFIPGLIISYIFFPKTKEFDSEDKESESIDWIERIALSFALSIAIVPLAVFYLNLIGVKINLLNSSLTILGIILISSGIIYWKKKK